jgi:hypothetical protein
VTIGAHVRIGNIVIRKVPVNVNVVALLGSTDRRHCHVLQVIQNMLRMHRELGIAGTTKSRHNWPECGGIAKSRRHKFLPHQVI